MSNRRSIADFPRNEAGLVDEFIGTAYDTVKKVYDNIPEIQRLDGVLETIDTVAEDTIDKVIEEKIPPIVEDMTNEVARAQAWAEGIQPDPEVPESKSSMQWASEAQITVAVGKETIDQAVVTGKGELNQSIQEMNEILVLVENAKDAALLSGGIFETVAEGMAATALNGYFSVPSSAGSEFLILYQNKAGVATIIDVYPSAQAVKAVTELIEGTGGDAVLFSDSNRFVLMKLLIDGTLDMLKSKLRNTDDGLTITDRQGFVSGYLRANETNLHGLIIRPTSLTGIYFTDERGFVVGKMASDGAFFGQVEGGGEGPVVPVQQVYVAQLGQQKRTDHKQIIMYGQSLSVGHSAIPVISATQPYNNLMLASGLRRRPGDVGYDATALVPLVEVVGFPDNQGETPVAGIVNGITRRAVEAGEPLDRWTMLGAAPGRSGWSVEQLSPAPLGVQNAFEKMLEVIGDSHALSKDMGKTYSVWAYCWMQGESNYSASWDNSPYEYMERMLNIFDTMTESVMKTTDQKFRPYTVLYQVAAHRRYNNDAMQIAKTQWRATQQRDDVLMAAPVYICQVAADNLHLTAEGSWLMGEYMSRAIHSTMALRGKKWRPLEPVAVEWTDTYLDIEFHVPCGKLVLDTALAAAYENHGFLIREDNVVVDVIQSVTVTPENTVRIALKRPTTKDALLTYARGKPGDLAHSGPATGARGNLRDSHGDFDVVVSPSGTTHALHNACVMFEYSRKIGF